MALSRNLDEESFSQYTHVIIQILFSTGSSWTCFRISKFRVQYGMILRWRRAVYYNLLYGVDSSHTLLRSCIRSREIPHISGSTYVKHPKTAISHGRKIDTWIIYRDFSSFLRSSLVLHSGLLPVFLHRYRYFCALPIHCVPSRRVTWSSHLLLAWASWTRHVHLRRPLRVHQSETVKEWGSHR